MKSAFLAVILVVAIATISISLLYDGFFLGDMDGAAFKKISESRVCIKGHCFNAEVAANSADIRTGLMFRDSLADDSGMLFVFSEEGVYSFWMKSTRIPLDIIWISQNSEIVFIKQNAQPCPQYGECIPVSPGKTARYVLEISGGLSEKFGFGIGDKVDMQLGNVTIS